MVIAPKKKRNKRTNQRAGERSYSKTIAVRDAPQGNTQMQVRAFPLPARLSYKSRYVETYTLTTGAAGIVGATQVNRLNSLFDPNQTGAGHQPYGYAQLAGVMYEKYWVRGVKITFTVTTIGGTADMLFAVQVGSSGAITTIAGLLGDYATERTNVSTFVLSPSGNTRSRSITLSPPLPLVLGVPAKQYRDAEDLYAALYTANPIEQAIIEFGAASYSGNAGETMQVQILMEFDAELFQEITTPHS